MLQEVTQQLMTDFNCYPVFLGAELKANYYKSEKSRRREGGRTERPSVLWALLPPPVCSPLPPLHAAGVPPSPSNPPRPHQPEFCKQQLWPILHYLVPLSPTSLGRFDPALWSAYVRANMAFAAKLTEVLGRWGLCAGTCGAGGQVPREAGQPGCRTGAAGGSAGECRPQPRAHSLRPASPLSLSSPPFLQPGGRLCVDQ